jgi:hypothetical protein
MAADRNTPEGVENWLIQSSTNPWSFPSIVGPELTREILQHICNRWSSYPSNIKLGVLFALLCIRKLLLSSMGNELSAVSVVRSAIDLFINTNVMSFMI